VVGRHLRGGHGVQEDVVDLMVVVDLCGRERATVRSGGHSAGFREVAVTGQALPLGASSAELSRATGM
jgi:hypothetical protein